MQKHRWSEQTISMQRVRDLFWRIFWNNKLLAYRKWCYRSFDHVLHHILEFFHITSSFFAEFIGQVMVKSPHYFFWCWISPECHEKITNSSCIIGVISCSEDIRRIHLPFRNKPLIRTFIRMVSIFSHLTIKMSICNQY